MNLDLFRKRLSYRSAANFVLFASVYACAYAGSYLLRFADAPYVEHGPVFLNTVGWILLIKLSVTAWFQLHRGLRRYVSFHDVLILFQAITCSSIAITLVDAMLVTQLTIPRSIILLDWGCSFVAVGALWALPRLLRDGGWLFSATGTDGTTPALIVGADDSGEGLVRAFRKMTNLNYCAVGFIDDRPELQGCAIAGVPVVGTTRNISELVKRYRAEEVLITAGDLPGKQVRQLVDVAQEQHFCLKVLPSFEQLLGDRVAVQPRQVIIEDLLRRPSVELDTESIERWLAGKTVLVTGSAGSIGSEICRQLLRLGPEKLVPLDRAETGQFFIERELQRLAPHVDVEACVADITDRDRMDAVFAQYKPDIIFHAAAYKHVPLMEAHPGEAVKNISLATRNLVDLAEEHRADAFVMISTDKAVNPTSVMGSCKRLAEQYVQARAVDSDCRLVTVRFGNVLDSAGSVIPIFREQIARGGPVTVTHPDMVRFFMLIPEAAQLVLQAGAMGQGGEIFVLDMGEPVRIADLARDMIHLSGFKEGEDIEIDFVGLRPGEKLYEELYGEEEHHDRTRHPKIMVAQGQHPNLFQISQNMHQLEKIANKSPAQVRALLHSIIPLESSHPVSISRAA